MTPRPLLGWLTEPDDRRGIRFYDRRTGWHFHSYAELAAMVRGTAARLRADGVRPGDAVAVVAGSTPEFVAAYFGVLAAGGTPAPLAPPALFQNGNGYTDRVRASLAAVGATAVVTVPEFAARLAEAGPAVRHTVVTATELAGDDAGPAGTRPAEHALLQFTSGSSGPPRAVAVPRTALEANVDAIRAWLGMGQDDPTATWLPPHHDMGLIGCLLTPVVNGSDVWMMAPQNFVRDPAVWLSCFGERGARLTASPTFGLAHVVRRVRADAVRGHDFGAWRAVIVGAERVDDHVLRRFADLLAPHGFDARAFLPAYGLAEATLAVTGTALADRPRTLPVARRDLTVGAAVRAVDGAEPALSVVGCGRPLVPGSTVRVVDEDGTELPAGHVGEIEVTGPSVAAGYVGASERAAGAGSAFSGDRVRTGDCGFLDAGELFVLGRLGDSIKSRGRTVFAEDVESDVDAVGEVRDARPAVLLGALDGEDTAVVVVERRPGPWAGEVARVLRPRLEGIRVVVVAAPAGTVRRTSSGKPRRRLVWAEFAAGRLAGDVVVDDRGGLPAEGDEAA